MAFSDPVVLTYNSVAKNLAKINQDNFGAVYFVEDGDRRLTLTIKHTIPPRGKPQESHLARLDVEQYDATSGDLLRTASAWTVIRTDNGIQDSTESQNAADALVGFLTTANVTKLIGRQS